MFIPCLHKTKIESKGKENMALAQWFNVTFEH